MQSMVCGQCGASWTEPDMFTEDLRSIVAAWVRSERIVIAMKQITANSPLNLDDAKAIAVHITQVSGACHECSYSLSGEPTDHCPFCQAVNYDW